MAASLFNKKHAFVLSPKSVGRIWEVLEKNFGDPRVEAFCSDDVQRTFFSLEDLLQYENPRSSSINYLVFHAGAADASDRKSALVSLGRDYSNNVQVSLEGPEKTVLESKKDISDVVDGMRPWYSWVSKVDFHNVLMVFLFFFVVVAVLRSGQADLSVGDVGFGMAAILASVLMLSVFGLAFLIWLLNVTRSRYFPMSVFELGQGEERNRTDERVRWGVFVALFVGIFLTLVGGIVSVKWSTDLGHRDRW